MNNKYVVGNGLTSNFPLTSKSLTPLEKELASIKEMPAIQEYFIDNEFELNPNLYNFRKGFTFQIFDSSFIKGDINSYLDRHAIPTIVSKKYLIISIESERDILRAATDIFFVLLNVCAAIKAGQKLSKNALEKSKKYIMDSNDPELLFRYKNLQINV